MEKTRKILLRFFKAGDETQSSSSIYYNYNSKNAEAFITDLSGLGYDLSDEYQLIGNTYVPTKIEVAQAQISFIINFKSYKAYHGFLSNVSFGKYRCRFEYQIDSEGTGVLQTFKRMVVISSINKTEKEGGYLKCQVTCKAIEPWNTTISQSINVTTNSTNYSFKNDSDYDVPIQFYCGGGSFTDLIMVINSSSSSKRFETTDASVTGYQTMRYSSEDNNIYCDIVDNSTKEIQNDLLTDKYLNFNNENIFKVPAKENSIFSFKTKNGSATVYLKLKKYYLSV